tara:strand:+ start:298 stop:1356 length:1059 start_codon:yes stop_codon:yes gene_type:complete
MYKLNKTGVKMTNFVKIKHGTYRKNTIENMVFPVLKPLNIGKKGAFITVNGSEVLGDKFDKIRVLIEDPTKDLEYVTPAIYAEQAKIDNTPKEEESEADAIERIKERFDILDRMTHAVAEGTVRGMIVSGPPGVGKSFGVETVLEEYDMLTQVAGKPARTEVVKGSVTPIGLFQTLFNNSAPGNILVFDDCDSVLFDEVCLNMLKATLDSGKKRTITWKSESQALRREGIPDRFEFKGGCIFITNVDFENVRSKKIKDHLAALMSRCHYLDLTMNSKRDKFLRINQIVRDGMLEEYGFGTEGDKEIIDFMTENQDIVREISLRMVLKIADLKKMDSENWQKLAKTTCMSGAI